MRQFGEDMADSFANILSGLYLDSASVATSGGTITVNFAGKAERLFYGDAPFSANKTIAMSNSTNAKRFELMLECDAGNQLTFPAGFIMSDGNWELDGDQKWTAPFDGIYHFKGSLFNTVWSMEANSTPKT
jgi:hypothetical protein